MSYFELQFEGLNLFCFKVVKMLALCGTLYSEQSWEVFFLEDLSLPTKFTDDEIDTVWTS